jgi:Fur family transcriptional regulator, stress-responsive regulator
MEGLEGASRLRAAGLRVTSVRLAILDAIGDGQHPGADEVAKAVRDRVGYVTLQAVYEALGAFVEAGLLRKIEVGGSAARFESRVGDNHHHIVCRRCGAVADVDCAVGHAPCLEPAAALGYAIDEAEVTFWGLCADCQAPAATRLWEERTHHE